MNTRLKKLFIFLFLVIALTFQAHNVSAQNNSEETRQIVVALFEAFNRHDVEALLELYSEDTMIVSPGYTEPRIGREVVREIYQGHFDNIPGVHDAVQNIVAEGDRAAVEFVATWEQPTENDPGARGSLKIATFITVQKGKITEDITYYDRLELTENMNIENGEQVLSGN